MSTQKLVSECSQQHSCKKYIQPKCPPTVNGYTKCETHQYNETSGNKKKWVLIYITIFMNLENIQPGEKTCHRHKTQCSVWLTPLI